jgi:hypothetical protein
MRWPTPPAERRRPDAISSPREWDGADDRRDSANLLSQSGDDFVEVIAAAVEAHESAPLLTLHDCEENLII